MKNGVIKTVLDRLTGMEREIERLGDLSVTDDDVADALNVWFRRDNWRSYDNKSIIQIDMRRVLEAFVANKMKR